MKRLTVLKHNYMPYIAALFVPLVLAGMVTRFLLSPDYENGLPCVDPSRAGYSSSFWTYPQSLSLAQFAYGPPEEVTQGDLKSLLPILGQGFSYYGNAGLNWNRTTSVNSDHVENG